MGLCAEVKVPNADGGWGAACAGVEKSERMSCLTSFLGAEDAEEEEEEKEEGAGAWKSREKRSFSGAVGCGGGGVGCGGAGAEAGTDLAVLAARACCVESSWWACGWRAVTGGRARADEGEDELRGAVAWGAVGAGGSAAGAGAPLSRTAGSEGGGPSIAQRRDSYFERMKDSILLCVRVCVLWRVMDWEEGREGGGTY